MAIKIKRRVEKPETEEAEVSADGTEAEEGESAATSPASDGEPGGIPSIPVVIPNDAVLESGRDLFSYVDQHRTLVIGGFVALLLGIVAWSAASSSRVSARGESGEQLHMAWAAGVAETPADGAEAPADALARRMGARKTALEAIPAEKRLPSAEIALASTQLALGEATQSQASFAASAARLNPHEKMIATFGEAAALAADGKLEDASARLDEVARTQPAFAYAASLRKAQLIDAYGTPDSALEALRSVVGSYPTAEDLDALNHRISQIEIALGRAPEAVRIAGDGEGSGS